MYLYRLGKMVCRMKKKLQMQKSDKDVEIISYYDETGKSFDELMQELILVFLPA
jgi:hypothetical protein